MVLQSFPLYRKPSPRAELWSFAYADEFLLSFFYLQWLKGNRNSKGHGGSNLIFFSYAGAGFLSSESHDNYSLKDLPWYSSVLHNYFHLSAGEILLVLDCKHSLLWGYVHHFNNQLNNQNQPQAAADTIKLPHKKDCEQTWLEEGNQLQAELSKGWRWLSKAEQSYKCQCCP